ncbi:hypothetical protein Ciccas_000889 [Cichlidogyrus casuarinus]|uniref:Uncharacterized protein n=1 Tax=Cichlidogyrus casuarinus TaxID=1844966 RepID=A0ABD2QLN2_9PLAT
MIDQYFDYQVLPNEVNEEDLLITEADNDSFVLAIAKPKFIDPFKNPPRKSSAEYANEDLNTKTPSMSLVSAHFYGKIKSNDASMNHYHNQRNSEQNQNNAPEFILLEQMIQKITSPDPTKNMEQYLVSLKNLQVPELPRKLAVLQHLTYKNRAMKEIMRQCEAIPQLASYLIHPNAYVRFHTAAILRNLSHNSTEEIQSEILQSECYANAIDLLRILAIEEKDKYSIRDITAKKDMTTLKNFRAINEKSKEMILAIICNLSSIVQLKKIITENSLPILVEVIGLPALGLELRPTNFKEYKIVAVSRCTFIHESPAFQNFTAIIK